MGDLKADYPVLRAVQLDTSELDQTLLVNLKQLLNQDIFKYIQLNILQKYNVELFAFVKFLIWYNTFYKNSQTVSQTIFDWSYRDRRRHIVILHGIIYCLDEWFEENLSKFVANVWDITLKLKQKILKNKSDSSNENAPEIDRRHSVNKFLDYFKLVYRVAKFLNYLVFLYEGKFLHIWERLLNLRPIYNRPPLMNTFNHDLTIREELWQAYFSIFTILDRFFNFRKMVTNLRAATAANKSQLQSNDQSVCAICLSEPTMAHRSCDRQCQHIFCYLCVKKELSESSGKYKCPACMSTITDVELFIKD